MAGTMPMRDKERTAFWLWKPTWPTAMEPSFFRLDQGV